jgi:hypothetical protein
MQSDIDEFESDDGIPIPRAREIRRAVNTILMEVPVDCHEDDVLDAVWGMLGELNADEEAVALGRIKAVRTSR